jgi:hypothetical protein
MPQLLSGKQKKDILLFNISVYVAHVSNWGDGDSGERYYLVLAVVPVLTPCVPLSN